MANETKVARLRAEAVKALTLATEIKDDSDVKLQLMEIAQKYERLADRLEKADSPASPSIEPPALPTDAPSIDIAAMKPQDDTEPNA